MKTLSRPLNAYIFCIRFDDSQVLRFVSYMFFITFAALLCNSLLRCVTVHNVYFCWLPRSSYPNVGAVLLILSFFFIWTYHISLR